MTKSSIRQDHIRTLAYFKRKTNHSRYGNEHNVNAIRAEHWVFQLT